VLRILALTGWEMRAWLPALAQRRGWRDALDVQFGDLRKHARLAARGEARAGGPINL